MLAEGILKHDCFLELVGVRRSTIVFWSSCAAGTWQRSDDLATSIAGATINKTYGMAAYAVVLLIVCT